MGDPKFSRRSYDTPSHPWQGERIKAEVEIVNAFGLKNKTEVWKAETTLRNLRKQSRDLQARLRTGDAQAKIEADALLAKCGRLGFLPADATLNDILTLKDEDVVVKDACAATVIVASGGYPGAYAKGKPIAGLDAAAAVPNAVVFHCGTKAADGQILTAGGRVLSVTGLGATLREAVDTAYRAVDCISFENAFHRKDIAHRAFERG